MPPISLDSLDRVRLTRRSLLNAGSPYRSLNTALVAFEYVSPEEGHFLLTTPGPTMKLSSLYQASESVSPEGAVSHKLDNTILL